MVRAADGESTVDEVSGGAAGWIRTFMGRVRFFPPVTFVMFWGLWGQMREDV